MVRVLNIALCAAMLALAGVRSPSARAADATSPSTTTAPATRPVTTTATAPAAPVDPKVADILERLEKRGDTISDLRCKVVQKMKGLVAGELIVKEGTIKYLRGNGKDVNPRFAIHFSKVVQDDFDWKPEWYVFDGRWFIEAKEATKNVVRREIVRPGEPLDLFRVEESPFPLPFGQKKSEILKHFDCRIVPPKPDDPKGTTHLLCVPKPDSPKALEYAEIHFYVDPKLDLPVQIVARRKTGKKVTEIHTVTFPDLSAKSLNVGLPGSEFDFKAPTGWAVTEDRLDAAPPPGENKG